MTAQEGRDTNTETDGRAVIPEPKPRYRRVIDHYECPVCGAAISGYNDSRSITPPGPTIRRFMPCMCITTGLRPVTAEDTGQAQK